MTIPIWTFPWQSEGITPARLPPGPNPVPITLESVEWGWHAVRAPPPNAPMYGAVSSRTFPSPDSGIDFTDDVWTIRQFIDHIMGAGLI